MKLFRLLRAGILRGVSRARFSYRAGSVEWAEPSPWRRSWQGLPFWGGGGGREGEEVGMGRARGQGRGPAPGGGHGRRCLSGCGGRSGKDREATQDRLLRSH